MIDAIEDDLIPRKTSHNRVRRRNEIEWTSVVNELRRSGLQGKRARHNESESQSEEEIQ